MALNTQGALMRDFRACEGCEGQGIVANQWGQVHHGVTCDECGGAGMVTVDLGAGQVQPVQPSNVVIQKGDAR